MQFKANDDLNVYTGMTSARVYEITMQGHGAHWASWELRVRPRLCRTGEHGLAIYDWQVIGTYKNPATAIAYANHHEEEVG
jgi:hypothetical protein